MQRSQLLDTFRQRLNEVIDRSRLTRSEFATTNDIDRSTLSQLLSSGNRRLPRVETLAAIAGTQQVSIDWLLGLSQSGPMQAELLQEQTSFALNALSPNDERLIAWFEEARGYKVRYVPSTLPDLLKTEQVIRFEMADFVASRPEQKIETAAVRLQWTRGPESDLECCSSVQSIEMFARGEGLWRQMPAPVRIAELERMIGLTTELYPTLRWFLFDGLQRYAAPVTIFGPKRAALYIGQMYMVLTSTEHVRTMIRHFDDLIRGAVVQANDVPAFLVEQLAIAKRMS